MNKALPLLAIFLASIALWKATVRVAEPPSTSSAPTANGSDRALAGQVGQLQHELRTVKAANTSLALKVMELEQAREAAAGGSVDADRVRQRLDALESKQTQLAQYTRDLDKYGVVATMEKELVNAYSTLMDTNQSFGARLKQAEQLKRYGYFDAKALQAVTDLYHQTENFNEKGFALSALKGVVTPAMRDQIISDLSADIAAGNQSARFRYHAIEALEPLVKEPTVQQWLNHLAQSDPEPKLAGRAQQAIGINPPAAVRK